MAIVIIWNKNKISEELVVQFPMNTYLLEQHTFDKFKFHNQPIFILAELTWNNHDFSDFYGFELIRNIRLIRKIKTPIVLFSFLPKSFFLEFEIKTIHNILKTPGHYFKQLPVDFQQLMNKNYGKLDDNTLYDINTHFFFTEGLIDEEIHQLKNKMIQTKDNGSSNQAYFKVIETHIQKTFTYLEKGLDLRDNRLLFSIQNQLLQDLKEAILENGNSSGNLTILNNYIGEIKRLLPPTNTKKIDQVLEKKVSWKVLFVDDDLAITKRIQSLFQARRIACEIALNANQAFDILQLDTHNDITVLICDYRMLNPDKSWQALQGYNILEHVFLHFPNEVALFSLTSFNKRTLLRIQKLHQMQVWSYSKDDVIGSGGTTAGFNVFLEKVIEEGNRVFNFKRSQPKTISWIKGYDKKFDRPLQAYYKQHRLAKDFESANIIIEQKASMIYEAIKLAKHGNGKTEELGIPNIQENIGKNKKTPQTEVEKLERFRERLLGRRVAIALHHLLEMSKEQIFNTMKRNHFSLRLPIENKNTVNQYFTTYMALSLEKDIPKNLLPEEKIWLNSLVK